MEMVMEASTANPPTDLTPTKQMVLLLLLMSLMDLLLPLNPLSWAYNTNILILTLSFFFFC